MMRLAAAAITIAGLSALAGCAGRSVTFTAGGSDGGAATDAGAGADAGRVTWEVASRQLTAGWQIQSSAEAIEPGETISRASYVPQGWHGATVPTTVFAALVAGGVYPDPFFGTNLRSVPGVSYPVGDNFSNYDVPDDSPFKAWWWYRTGLELPALPAGQQVWVSFSGINYRGRVYFNGAQISETGSVEGAFRAYEFNLTAHATQGDGNVLAVKVAAPDAKDLGITFVDWNPAAPDKDMGLWNDVTLRITGPVALRNPVVRATLDPPSGETARLTITVEAVNGTDSPIACAVSGEIEGVAFSQVVALAPGEARPVAFVPGDFPQLVIAKPRLWWPYLLGAQELYTADLQASVGGATSDRARVRFGVREVTAELDANGHRLFRVNYRNVLIRGAGYTPDMLLRRSDERDEADIRYVKGMNLNAIRLEGKLGNRHLLDLCDEQGVMVVAGWCCCDFWEEWPSWNEQTHEIAAASQRDQIRAHINHPSVIAWLNGSDRPPTARAEKMYLQILEDEGWPNPVFSSADDAPAQHSGPSGVKMTGPYEWVPPHYWLTNKDRGGAFGFNTETSPGPAIPALESLARMLPPEHHWPVDDAWNFHAGGGVFRDVHVFSAALAGRHGAPTGPGDFNMKSQLMAYEGIRAMFEAYGANKYTATGVIQWMLNNAWPSIIWHLYDYFLKPGGGYFGAQKACEPLHAMYRYDDGTVAVVNSRFDEYKGVVVSAKIFDLSGAEQFSRVETIDVGADAAARVFGVPSPAGVIGAYLLRLDLSGPGVTPSRNVYWLSIVPDVLDDAKADWYFTPTSQYADLTGLNGLAASTVTATSVAGEDGGESAAAITLENTSGAIALFVRAEVVKGAGGGEVVPIYYSDNYVSLWPGEKTTITATYRAADLLGMQPHLRVEGFNVATTEQAAGR